jgi:hypothetical protein
MREAMQMMVPHILHNQIILVLEVGMTLPVLSCEVISRNMLMHNSLTKTIVQQHTRSIPALASSISCQQAVTKEI